MKLAPLSHFGAIFKQYALPSNINPVLYDLVWDFSY